MDIIDIFDLTFFSNHTADDPYAGYGVDRYHCCIIVCAHNEENVIKSLFESIRRQKYDPQKIHVFLLADHCTDSTADIGRKYPFIKDMLPADQKMDENRS